MQPMIYEIEAGIPLPDTGAGRPGSYPLHQMSVGDSIRVPRWINLRKVGRPAGMSFVCRKDATGQHRVWRTE